MKTDLHTVHIKFTILAFLAGEFYSRILQTIRQYAPLSSAVWPSLHQSLKNEASK